MTEFDKTRPQFVERRSQPLPPAQSSGATATRKKLANAKNRYRGRNRGQRKKGIMPCQDKADSDQTRKIANAAENPKFGSERVRGAKLNGAQRRPLSGCEI